MPASIVYRDRPTGFSHEQMARAFDRVRDPRDWRASINAEIPSEDRLVVQAAVIWFTATVPMFMPIPGQADRLLVTALGHRFGLASDEAETRHELTS